jgi:hypothetical protein
MEALVCLDFGLLLGDAGKSFLPGAAADRLRGYAGRAHEGSTHTVTVTKTRFSSDEVDGVSTLLYHQSGCFDAEPFNRFGRRLTRLRTKRTAELTWTEVRGVGELVDRQWGIEVILCINQGALNAVRFRFKF